MHLKKRGGCRYLQPLFVFVRGSLGVIAVFAESIKECFEILCWYSGLDVVYSVENVTSSLAKDLNVLLDLGFYLLWCAEGKDMLCIYAASPENEFFAPAFF